MELTSLPSLIFSPSADDISIAAEGDVVVRVMLSSYADRTVFDNTSTYSPGSDGNVHIVDLSELVNAVVLSDFDSSGLLVAGARSMSCQLNISVKDGASVPSRAVYMWRNHTDVKPMFATQLRRRSLQASRG